MEEEFGDTMEEEMVRPSTRYKGVLQRPNGNWGAQIYACNHRIWLGTFGTELEAALAYDSASLKLRWGGLHRNFPWTPITTEEVKFQTQYSTEEILEMIREGSYISMFFEHARYCHPGHGIEVVTWRELFRKELTPSDVGPLNRMVIPKRYATQYFPEIQSRGETLQLAFWDGAMRLWTFRYCYWGSSGSYVLTKGWNNFVKEKGLKEKDFVAFLECDCRMTGTLEWQKLCIIHAEKSSRNGGCGAVNADDQVDGMEVDLKLRLGVKTGNEEKSMEPPLHGGAVADFKLFGKQIF